MSKKLFITFVLLTILLVSCRKSQDTPSSTNTPSSQETVTSIQAAYPEPGTPYPLPQNPTPGPYTFRTSKPGTATIHGELLVRDPENAMPASNDAIYLVPLPADEAVIAMPSISFGESPQADVNEITGEFVFTDIQPGKYMVLVYTIHNSQIPTHTNDGELVVVEVKDTDRDKTIELNYINVP